MVIFGATGNVGTSLLRALADEDGVEEIVGAARRRPALAFARTRWVQADIERDDLAPIVRGADAVVHLAWRIQPSRDLADLRRTNVDGSERVFRAVAEAGVPALVYASSVGAYSAGPKDRRVDESWPTEGIATSFYGVHKAEVERRLDVLERERPDLRIVRLRPALIFKREAASGIRRLFLGPLVPRLLMRPGLIPAVPDMPRFRFQAVHSLDVGQAYRLAIVSDVRGPFNIAADPVLDPRVLSEVLGARRVPVPSRVARAFAAASWRLRLQPTPEGWFDLAVGVPLLDSTRAHEELGWEPHWSATDALLELLDGLRDGAGVGTPPLDPGKAPVSVGGREAS